MELSLYREGVYHGRKDGKLPNILRHLVKRDNLMILDENAPLSTRTIALPTAILTVVRTLVPHAALS